MMNIDKRRVISDSQLSGEDYFSSLMKAALSRGLMSGNEIESIQMACINFLAYKCERYNSGDSSSIKVETAESIMRSNLYTMGLYLKSLEDADSAVKELKSADVTELYRKGRELINIRFRKARKLYRHVGNNKLDTDNHTYNATVCDDGIGSFFRQYDPDYAAHEIPASIDYQLCNSITDLCGVEYIERYLVRLFLENEFCKCFRAEDIRHLLSGYDKGYSDLLINIFEQVLTGAICCRLAGRRVVKLKVARTDIQLLYNRLSVLEEAALASEVSKAAVEALEELGIENRSIRKYVQASLKKINASIRNAVRTDTLEKTFVAPIDTDTQPKVRFEPGVRMEDEKYRELLDELNSCRNFTDKLALIKEQVRSFGDFEDILLDALLEEGEINTLLELCQDIELAALLRHHPEAPGIQAVELTEGEQRLRAVLYGFIDRLAADRRYAVLALSEKLIED